jgi:RNA polymerase subunit RPABC4/transcription elongation factor Spt4
VEVMNGSVCGKCGALIQQGSEFCPSCGDKL